MREFTKEAERQISDKISKEVIDRLRTEHNLQNQINSLKEELKTSKQDSKIKSLERKLDFCYVVGIVITILLIING